MKITLINVVTLTLFVGCATSNQEEMMRRQFEAYIEAVNEHKIDTILSFLSDQFQLEFSDYDMTIDKKGMVSILGWDKGVNGKVTYEKIEVEGDSLKGLFTERNDFLKLIGIEEIKAQITYRFDESGLVVRQIYMPLPGQPSFQEKMQPAIAWARENRPAELNEIYPGDQMQYNQEMGERWVVLLREWKAATQSDRG